MKLKQLATTLLLLLVAITTTAGTYTIDDLPVTTSGKEKFVCNPDGILSPAICDSINQLMQQLEDSTTAQVLVVAVDNISPEDPFNFSIDLGNKIGVGQKDKNNGVILLVVKDLHKVRISTGGGLSGDLPDAICKIIIDRYITPRFKEGNYDQGVWDGVKAINGQVGGTDLITEDEDEEAEEDYGFWDYVEIILGVILILAICGSPFIGLWLLYIIIMVIIGYFIQRKERKCPHCGIKMEKKEEYQTKDDKSIYDNRIYYCPYCKKTTRVKIESRSIGGSNYSYTGDSSSDSDYDSGSDFGGGDFDGGGAEGDW